ncbi:carotenoid oxygenase family protein [Nocardioides sp.]|jgi:carotenoid cleavage dioxygenase|uniref:carotenoid oxygenase family protein n=1 Tax=Nocardioides sp. TaxID=35761 RepID=UPI0031FEEFE9|nr:carotenoid oxygenase [Nocardioides sp.]
MANRYLQDNFAPVRDELTATDLVVTGEIPSHLDGRYLRIGPNPLADPGQDYHWFLGDGMVHGVRIGDGRAQWYRNRWVRSGAVADALGEPRRGTPGPNDFAANTNVIEHAGRTLALVEAGSPPYELTHDLDTVGPCDFDGTLRGGYTAHPHEDPDTGELHAISYSWTRGNRLDYSVLDTDGRVRRTVDVEVTGSPMVHDFALTEHYVVVYDLPVTFDVARVTRTMPRAARLPARIALSRVIGRNPLPEPVIAGIARRGSSSASGPAVFPYSWNPDYPARIGLLPREGDGREVRWFEIEPCYVFHTLNAFEDGDDVVIDVVRHERMFATDLNGPNEGDPTLARFTLDTSSGKVREDRFDERGQEFPRYDERRTGRRHRYGYTVGFADATLGDTVLKHDVAAGHTTERRLGAGREASEFCFVPSAADSAEDDGVLMGYVHDRASGLSDLVMLDAGTLEDVARVHLPGRVPVGFHGNWAPTD